MTRPMAVADRKSPDTIDSRQSRHVRGGVVRKYVRNTLTSSGLQGGTNRLLSSFSAAATFSFSAVAAFSFSAAAAMATAYAAAPSDPPDTLEIANSLLANMGRSAQPSFPYAGCLRHVASRSVPSVAPGMKAARLAPPAAATITGDGHGLS